VLYTLTHATVALISIQLRRLIGCKHPDAPS
jgi:hypothetical protein